MTHQFTFEGQSRTLFTRSEKPAAPWYLKLRKHGKQEWINLRTHNVREAEDRAKRVVMERAGGPISERLRNGESPSQVLRQRNRRPVAELEKRIALLEEALQRATKTLQSHNIPLD